MNNIGIPFGAVGFQKTGKIIANNTLKFTDLYTAQEKVWKIIVDCGLTPLKVVSHIFPDNSFSLSILLEESHVDVFKIKPGALHTHTWPKEKFVLIDVFACNYSTDNSGKVKEIFARLVEYFNGEIASEEEHWR